MNKRKRKLARAKAFKAQATPHPLNLGNQDAGLLKAKASKKGSEHPCFSFDYLTKQDKFNFNYFKHDKTAEDKAKAALIDKMLTLSTMPWSQIDSLGKKVGFEYIPVNELKFNPEAGTPLTDDRCMVFRFMEEKYRVLGFKEKGDPTFYIVGFDFDYGAYNHGK